MTAGGSLTGQRVLVTGASGFLGGHLCTGLLAAGAEVHAVSRAARQSADERLRWWQADVEDLDAARRLISAVKPERVYHLSGLINGAPDLALVLPTFHSLVTSTVHLLTAVAGTECRRFVLVGSLEEPTDNAAEACPTSPYGAAKWAASAYGRMFRSLFDVPVVIARTHMTYGPGQPTWKLIPYTILSLLRNEPPRLSSGRRPLDWVYVDDVVEGLLLAGSASGLEAPVELGSGTLTPIRDVVTRLVDLVAPAVQPIFDALPDRPRETERAADIAATRARLGWSPTTPLDEGLARTVRWYRGQHLAEGRSR
jgi:nucleoside-diphosphate-sugar epimerase